MTANQPPLWSRRRFVATGGSGLAVTFGGLLGSVVETVFADPAGATGAPTITVRLVRPDDQLDVVVELFDVTLDAAAGLLRSAGADPRLRLILGSQHTAEDAFVDPDATPPGATPIGHRAAGPSSLVASLATPVPFTVDDLLDGSNWTLRTTTTAGTPADDTTAIEVPTGLILAPGAAASVVTTGAPRVDGDVTELWRIALDNPTDAPLDIVAVANVVAADAVANPVPDAVQRDELVANTTAVAPATSDRLVLSGQGAFAEIEGGWEGRPVSRWRQTIVSGRDVVAEVVQEGYLMPFGHRAKILEINSRRFVLDGAGDPTAVLSFERFLAIDETEVVFDGEAGAPGDPGTEYRENGGRGLPFSRVTIAPTEWIPIDEVPVSDGDGTIAHVVDLVPAGHTDPLELVFDATDRAGNGGIGFSVPATFVETGGAHATSNGATLDRLARKYLEPGWRERLSLALSGRRVAWADEPGAGSGATTFTTEAAQLVLGLATGSGADLEGAARLGLFPVVEVATIVDDAISSTMGQAGVPIDVVPHPRWLEFGLGSGNFDLAFLGVLDDIQAALGSEGRSVVAIDLIGDLLNQTAGVGLDLAEDAVWTALDALGEDSKLLGLVPLSDLIPDVDVADALPGIDIPGLSVEILDDAVKSTFTFTPAIGSLPALGFHVAGTDPRAFVENVTCVPFSGMPENTLTVRLDDVTLEIPPVVPLVELEFSRIEVIESSTDGLTVDPELGEWRWGPFLSFLSPVTNLLDGLGSGLLDVSSRAIELSQDFSLPSTQLGVITIRNAGIFTSVELPFSGDDLPAVGLGLGSVSHPVEITVLSFGASFYLEVDVSPGSPGGLRRLAAGVELLAQLFGIDIVVASANVSLRLGAFFSLTADAGITFRGSISIEGKIEVLGLIDVSAALVASLLYRENKQDLKVSGHIEWAVETFLGGPSGTIPLGEMRYELASSPAGAAAGAAGAEPAAGRALATTTTTATTAASPGPAEAAVISPPSFGDRFTESEWRDRYVTAFA